MARENKKTTSSITGKSDSKSVKSMNSRKFNRRNSSKNQRRVKEAIDSEIKASGDNAIAWHTKFPQFAKDVATLGFGVPTGQPVWLTDTDWVANAGIMTLEFTPTPGISNDLTSPVNRQAARVYTYLRSIQRAAATYDQADLMIYLLGIDSLYTFWAYLRRAYGVAQLFTPMNVYYPRQLLINMGIDPSITGNLADFRAFINRFALNIGRFAMPKNFDITQRHMWMCSGLYLDSNTTRAQTYMFVPHWLYTYDNTVSTGSQLKGVLVVDDQMMSAANLYTLKDLVDLANLLISNFENDEDTLNISGDIYRAYEGNLMSVEDTVEGYAIAPTYSEEVSSMIENAILVGDFYDTTSSTTRVAPVISQNPSVNNGAILFQPYVNFSPATVSVSATENVLLRNYAAIIPRTPLNAHWDNPTSDQVIEMTRFQARALENSGYLTDSATHGVAIGSCSADLINQLFITTSARGTIGTFRTMAVFSNTFWTVKGQSNVAGVKLELAALLQQFDWCPLFYVAEFDNDTHTVDLLQVVGDVDNFTAVSYTNMDLIHEASLLSLLEVPQPHSK